MKYFKKVKSGMKIAFIFIIKTLSCYISGIIIIIIIIVINNSKYYCLVFFPVHLFTDEHFGPDNLSMEMLLEKTQFSSHSSYCWSSVFHQSLDICEMTTSLHICQLPFSLLSSCLASHTEEISREQHPFLMEMVLSSSRYNENFTPKC